MATMPSLLLPALHKSCNCDAASHTRRRSTCRPVRCSSSHISAHLASWQLLLDACSVAAVHSHAPLPQGDAARLSWGSHPLLTRSADAVPMTRSSTDVWIREFPEQYWNAVTDPRRESLLGSSLSSFKVKLATPCSDGVPVFLPQVTQALAAETTCCPDWRG